MNPAGFSVILTGWPIAIEAIASLPESIRWSRGL